MLLISWNDKFSIDVPMIDEQHKTLFKIMGDLHNKINDGDTNQLIPETINKLIDYTQYHFKEEEDYMFNIEYPRFEQHKTSHDNLTQQVLQFKKEFESGKGSSEKILQFIFEWLTKHIMEEDKKIGKYMNIKILGPIMKD